LEPESGSLKILVRLKPWFAYNGVTMYCFQCQETKKNSECKNQGFCGKQDSTARLQDVLLYVCKGIAVVCESTGQFPEDASTYVHAALFSTVTNVSFDDQKLIATIEEGLSLRESLKQQLGVAGDLPDCVMWQPSDVESYLEKSEHVGVLEEVNEDIRSLKELLIYGLKGVAAYAEHAMILGMSDAEVNRQLMSLLASSVTCRQVDALIEKVMSCGQLACDVLALLDKANTQAYGAPEMTSVTLDVGGRPGILISGHDLKDLEMLLEQTKDSGVDVYTHGEMLPAHYYPKFKQYGHLRGNYGGAWWQQKREFAAFNGPILMTTNCLMPPREEYSSKVFTTGNVNFPGLKHIASDNGNKDFSALIELAKTCEPPEQLESGEIVGGFAHAQVLKLADKVVEAVKRGAIKRFVVMAGCDGAHKTRQYFTDVAQTLPEDTVILTAGCAKYRYNKLALGDIGGIPRVLDAGQCNDSYSLVVIAQALQQVFQLDDINDLPISFDLAWYEQKAVAVLLALLSLGVKGIRLGPTLPAFLSPGVVQVLVDTFNIKPIESVDGDVQKMMMGA